jgi:hypothetical protein
LIDRVKRKLSAKEILADIRSGMDANGLKSKYQLSDRALDAVCAQLAAKGALTEDEIHRLRRLPDASEAAPKIPERPRWSCPACNTPQATEMPECPACGVVVEKFVAAQGKPDHVLSAVSFASPDTGPPERTGWAPIIMSIVVFAVAGTCLLLWSTHRSTETHKISELDAGVQSLQQAETEADRTQEDSVDLESADKEYSEVDIGDAKDIVLFQPPTGAIPQESPERAVAVPREKPPPPREQTPPPREETTTPPTKPKYVTGVLRQFSSSDFKKEVVEASKTHPVLFQFYSQT